MPKGTTGVRGAARTLGAALSGDTGILRTLEDEHAELLDLMDELVDAGYDAIEERRELYPAIRDKLLVHCKAEDVEFYPVCKAHPDTRELTVESMVDHEEIERLAVALDGMPIDAPAWFEVFQTLRDSVEEHIELEESELFAMARQAFGRPKLRELDALYLERKKRLARGVDDIQPTMLGDREPRPHH